MADFCKQCSIAMFGQDFGELALAPDDPKRGTLGPDMGWLVLCESCGAITVSDDGECLSPNCPIHGDNPTMDSLGRPIRKDAE